MSSNNEWLYTEWYHGYKAFISGIDLKNNPYLNEELDNMIHSKIKSWKDGWLQAQKDTNQTIIKK